ncbi:MAG: hypothetical protein IJT78_00565 [Oscillospiraceae bacterium]|nr:hypothetical protein [Oscillospiraceae bacterium]
MKKKTAILVSCLAALLVVAGIGGWLLVRHWNADTGNKAGIEWYSLKKTEYTITTAQELYDMAKLSRYYDFAGQTFKLGADIVMNEGAPEDWGTTMPEYLWDNPIYGFAGTFDGQGHTISGVYAMGYALAPLDIYYEKHPTVEYWSKKALYLPTGLFAYTKQECLIKNLNVVDSIFYNWSNNGGSSVVSNGAGTLDTVYSSATVVDYNQYAGGLVGLVENGVFHLENCWFDGELRMEGPKGYSGGGLIGGIKKSAENTTITHCLNTADISNEYWQDEPGVGGFVGLLQDGAHLKIADSLAVGSITVDRNDSVGTAVGRMDGGAVLSAENAYTNLDGYPAVTGYWTTAIQSYPIGLKKECYIGNAALQWANLDYENYWTIVEGSTPVLRVFAKQVSSETTAEKAYDISWYDEEKSEYTLTTLDQLYGFYILSADHDFAGKTVKLGADITVNEGDAKDWAEKAPEKPWYPINRFAGTFDGQGHTISGVYLFSNQPGTGLFTYTTDTGILENFKLVNSYFVNRAQRFSFMGSVVGCAEGSTIDTVYSNAIMSGTAVRSVGGIVGNIVGSGMATATNCWFDGTITLGEKASQAGGIVARNENGSSVRIKHCLNTGSISGGILKGGIIGLVMNGVVEVSDCLNAGMINGEKHVGAATSWIEKQPTLSFENTYAAAESCVSTVDNVQSEYTGGCMMIGKDYLTGSNAYCWTMLDFDEYWAIQPGGTPILRSFAENVPSVDGLAKKMDVSWYSVREKEYVLGSPEELYGFTYLSYNTDFARKTVKLGGSIALNRGGGTDPWFPVCNFNGAFDGQGHTVSGLYLASMQSNVGMFGETREKSLLTNFRLVNSRFIHEGSNNAFMGSIVGRLSGEVRSVYSSATIRGDRLVYGGIAGTVSNNEALISDCWFDGTIRLGAKGGWCGGILGLARSSEPITIEHCLNTGSISTQYNDAPSLGGICGLVQGDNTTLTVKDSLNAGKVQAAEDPAYVTGMIGYIPAKSNVTMDNVYLVVDGNPYRYGGSGKPTGLYCKVERNMITGLNGYRLTTLDFDNYWVARTGDVPGLRTFSGGGVSTKGIARAVDTSWYSAGRSTYVLTDAADLMGFTLLSQVENFKGKTVKLGADITVNAGDAAQWSDSAPEILWVSALRFAGTFDGQGHTISGMYQNTAEQNGGLFSSATADAVIKDLRLVNSYFTYTGQKPAQMGSIVGEFAGKIERVYSSAIIRGDRLVYGGMAGRISGEAVMDSCWFNGNISLGAKGGWCGGFAGSIGKDCTLTVRHCLTTGHISSEYDAAPSIGGICGNVSAAGAKLTVSDTLVASGITCPATSYVGAVTGNISEGAVATLDHTYVTYETHTSMMGNGKGTRNGSVTNVLYANLLGVKGYQFTELDFANYWAAESNSVPVPKALAKAAMTIDSEKAADTSWYTEEAYQTKGYYELNDAADLYGFQLVSAKDDFAGKTLKLGADMDLNPGWDGSSTPANVWTPVASAAKPFAGTFDGQGHTIRGMYLDVSMRYSGFFAATSSEAVLKDFRLENGCVITNQTYAGSVAGGFAGTAERIYSNVSVTGSGSSRYGGLFGANTGAVVIRECWYDGAISAPGKSYIGGLIGSVQEAEQPAALEHSLFSGTVSGSNQVGGLVGFALHATEVTLHDCASLGTVSGTARSGMLVGENAVTLTITHSAAANEGTLKALIGVNSGSTDTTDSIRYVTVTPASFHGLGGLAVLDGRSLLPEQWQIRSDGVPVPKYFGASESDTYTISTAEDLLAFAAVSQSNDFAGWTIKLGADIDLNEGWDASTAAAPAQAWTPIGSQSKPFAGTFDGQGHTISGVYLAATTARQGLFAETAATAVLKDFRLRNSYFTTSTFRLGSIVGNLKGTAERIYSDAFVVATGSANRIGGLFGVVNNATVSECWYDGAINAAGKSYVGGLIGSVQDADQPVTLEHSLFSGTVSGSNQVGGLIGISLASATGGVTIHDSASLGTVAGTAKSGMLVGENAVALTVTHSVAANEGTLKALIGANSGSSAITDTAKLTATTPSMLTGSSGSEKLSAQLDFTSYWVIREDAVPAPKQLVGAE